jgi:hypothetical protein
MERTMSNYPTGTCAADPRAPWNAPDTADAERFAHQQVTGDDIGLTTETLGEFLYTVDEKRLPLQVKTEALRGPISSAELLKLMLDRRNTDQVIAAATRELASRYLDHDYTRRVVDNALERFMGATV